MVRIVLHVESNQCLRNTVDSSQSDCRSLSDPEVLQSKEEGNVASASEVPPVRSEFLSTAYNFEYFPFDFLLKGSVELVSAE